MKTVVLIVQHSDQGALGLVLNRPTEATIKQVWEQIKETPCASAGSLYLGGPIEGPLVALHAQAEHADMEVLPGVFYSIQPEHLEKLVTATDEPVRFIAGYAGWGPGQLEAEIEQGAWLNGEAKREQVFRDEVNAWERATKELGDSTLVSLLNIKHVPPDPRSN